MNYKNILLIHLMLVLVGTIQAQPEIDVDVPVDEGKEATEIFSRHVNRIWASWGLAIPIGAFTNDDVNVYGSGGAQMGFFGTLGYSHHWPGKLRSIDYRSLEKSENSTKKTRLQKTWRNFHGINVMLRSGNFPQSKEWMESVKRDFSPQYEYRVQFTGYNGVGLAIGYSSFTLSPRRFFAFTDVSFGANLTNIGDYVIKRYQNGVFINEYTMASNQSHIALMFDGTFGFGYRLTRQVALRFQAGYFVSGYRHDNAALYWQNDDNTVSGAEKLYLHYSLIQSLNLGIGLQLMLSKRKYN
jgi:hypothetical protein